MAALTPTDSPIRWPAEAIWEAVVPLWPGFTVEVLPQVDSTNTELMRRARAGRNEPVLLIAEHQTQGRGRLGREWHSQKGDSLMFSLGLPLAPVDWSGLSLAVGLSLASSLHPDIVLKWPNDLWLWSDAPNRGAAIARKLGGILIETATITEALPNKTLAPGHARYAVMGVGLNLRAPPDAGLRTPSAGLQMLLPEMDAPTALLQLVKPLVAAVAAFAQHGFAPLQSRFHARDALLGRSVQFGDGQSALHEGVAQGVDAQGALLVQTANGVQRVTSTEVSVRPVA